MRVTGRIPFYVNTQVDPYNAITGGGTATVKITGAHLGCSLSGTGIWCVNNIIGELTIDHLGIAWLEMELDETLYESTILYTTCPDPENNSQQQMPSGRCFTQVRFIVEDGYQFTLPDIDCRGSGNYILHIIHQP